MRAIRSYVLPIALAAALLTATPCMAQTAPTIIESEGEASIAVVPDEVGFRLERRFSGPTLTDALKQVRAFERAIAQGATDIELTVTRQEPARMNVGQRPIGLNAYVELWVPASTKNRSTSDADALIEIAERVRKLGVTVSADVRFGGYGVLDREPVEQDAVARAAENALYLADAAGELAQRHVVDVERLTIVATTWEGVGPTVDGNMPVPAEVVCRARIRIAYRYESGGARR